MPYIRIDTNIAIPSDRKIALLEKVSAAISAISGKPESLIQAGVDDGKCMITARSGEPTAYVDYKAINLPPGQTEELSTAICTVLAEIAGIAGDRVNITFTSFSGSMWGKDGHTFR